MVNAIRTTVRRSDERRRAGLSFGTSQVYAPLLGYRGLSSTLTLNGSAVIQVP